MAFVVVAAVLTVTPGADTMLVIKNVLRGGRNDGIATTFGICTGLFIHATLSALGISFILMHSATLFHTLKMIGAVYIVWLGIQSLRRTVCTASDMGLAGSSAENTCSYRKCFTEGFLCNVLNPKVAVFYLAFLPQFIGADDPVLGKSLLLAGIHYIMSILWLVFLSAFLARTRNFMVRTSVRRWLEGICGTILIGLGIRLAFAEK
jgi:RhtB (resistance to homoserine/threonine) family protein